MRLAIGLGVLVAVGCGRPTPYQPLGYNGGYRDRSIGEGRHFVEVVVNQSTSPETAIGYLKRRAVEVCAGAGVEGYGNVKSRPELSPPRYSVIVECRSESEPERGAHVTAPPPQPAPTPPSPPAVRTSHRPTPTVRAPAEPEPDGGWYCWQARHYNSATWSESGCERTRVECDEALAYMKASPHGGGAVWNECQWQPRAACLRYRNRIYESSVDRCSSKLSQCDGDGEYLRTQERDYEMLVDCRIVE